VSASITVPALVRSGDAVCVVSVSGGKDSTATILALREAEVPARYVFADTQWEADETYAYLDTLRERLGITIDDVTTAGMEAKIRHQARFPSRMQRWCTKELKLQRLRAHHAEIESGGAETVCVVGVRAEESPSRAAMCTWEDDEMWGGWVWRPILNWPIADVLAIHHRHGVPVNPLYEEGFSRVGCFPCIMANKSEIALLARNHPERIDRIRALESEVSTERARRNAAEPGRYEQTRATFFRRGNVATPIDEVVAWSQTSTGGRQLPMFAEPPDGGCFRWGLCEPPAKDGDE